MLWAAGHQPDGCYDISLGGGDPLAVEEDEEDRYSDDFEPEDGDEGDTETKEKTHEVRDSVGVGPTSAAPCASLGRRWNPLTYSTTIKWQRECCRFG